MILTLKEAILVRRPVVGEADYDVIPKDTPSYAAVLDVIGTSSGMTPDAAEQALLAGREFVTPAYRYRMIRKGR